jgi:phospholipid-binding lipoprotein MlaA
VKPSIFGLLLLLFCLLGCANSGEQVNVKSAAAATSFSRHADDPPSASRENFANVPVQKVSDPFERLNRTIFRFNDGLITYGLRPLAHGYGRVVPRPVRTGISNFFDNLDFPIRFANCLLQGRFTRSGQEVGKFVINSTAGVGGLFRVSDHVNGLTDVPAEDFGLTLGRWGFAGGPYVVVPVLGPSDFRDVVGFAGDYVIHPLNWYQVGIINDKFISNAARYALGGTRFVARLPMSIDIYDQLKAGAIDPYIAIRNGYLSYRAAQLKK